MPLIICFTMYCEALPGQATVNISSSASFHAP
jgi:hypothetical protein